ncbi:HNH endonuclease signature motif containing protein [Nocardioides sp. Kera G14]|uniref:HNH endonuclease signature motif containing protein n=1 Tax=Nocardioides sp. Kera G14 TaxID=2884264 RepID=UPI001D0F92AD|nr:HNH endonuclease signature motif containing protein [Nocardioides sp. Kera G14]UDY24117.1 HNH endonuclease [Nocardioides sp. Kera G14]
MVVQYVEPTHPIVAGAQQIREILGDLADVNPLFMSPGAQAEALREMVAATNQLTELQARVMASAAQVADDAGKHDTAGWLAHETHIGPREARAQKRLAEALEAWPAVAAGMRAGVVNREQAEIITRALNALPDDTAAELIPRAEAHLVDEASRWNPNQLRVLARQVLDVIDPDGTEAREAKKLEAEERTAFQKTRLSFAKKHDGTTKITIVVPDLTATRLAHLLHAFTSPRHDPADKQALADAAGDEAGERVWWKLPNNKKLGHAFCELLENIDPNSMPQHGTTGTELIVTIPLADLRRDLAAATVLGPHGVERITANEARRLACEAGIIPAVLGGQGHVLDLGRTSRLATKAQKKALILIRATCSEEGCDVPAAMTEVHHLNAWSQGGKTDLKDLVLLCKPGHRRIHSPDYTHERLPDGTIRFYRRT